METGIEKAQRINRERKENGEKVEINHNWIVKSKKAPSSLKYAINAKCFECFGGTADELPDGGWKKMIGTCTAQDCPLYSHRPYRNSNSGATELDGADEI